MLNRSLLLGEETGAAHLEHVVFESACSRRLSGSLCQFVISGTSIERRAGGAEKSADACSGAAVKLGDRVGIVICCMVFGDQANLSSSRGHG
jgi:hypothetical protein